MIAQTGSNGSKIVTIVIRSYGWSDTGCVRPHNEDRILADDTLGLYVVADGMGGHTHGEVAAQIATDGIQAYVQASKNLQEITWPFGYDFERSPNENRLSTAIQLASRRVFERAVQIPEMDGMGTTVAAVLLESGMATVASVGDSRVYLFSGDRLETLTVDDTWVGAMVRQGSLRESEIAQHPMRNVLTQAAGVRETVDVQVLERRLSAGDQLLLTSDGLHGVVGDDWIGSVLAAELELKAAVERLLRSAQEQGAPDNVSCVLIRYGIST
jgi:PPM family protein phosphatase